jgi:hypothetical protein
MENINSEKIIYKINLGETFSLIDGHDTWRFKKSYQKDIAAMEQQFRGLAMNPEGQLLCISAAEPLSVTSKLFSVEENEYFYQGFSMSELINKKEIQKIASKINTGKIKKYNEIIEQYAHCPGSLYWIALQIKTSVYDDNFSEGRNATAIEVFKSIALKGDPRACKEVADY